MCTAFSYMPFTLPYICYSTRTYVGRTAGAQTPVGVCACRQCSQFLSLVDAVSVDAVSVVAAANTGEQKDADQPIAAAAAVVEQAEAITAAAAIVAAPKGIAVQEEQQDKDPDPAGHTASIVVRSADAVVGIVASAVGSS